MGRGGGGAVPGVEAGLLAQARQKQPPRKVDLGGRRGQGQKSAYGSVCKSGQCGHRLGMGSVQINTCVRVRVCVCVRVRSWVHACPTFL